MAGAGTVGREGFMERSCCRGEKPRPGSAAGEPGGQPRRRRKASPQPPAGYLLGPLPPEADLGVGKAQLLQRGRFPAALLQRPELRQGAGARGLLPEGPVHGRRGEAVPLGHTPAREGPSRRARGSRLGGEGRSRARPSCGHSLLERGRRVQLEAQQPLQLPLALRLELLRRRLLPAAGSAPAEETRRGNGGSPPLPSGRLPSPSPSPASPPHRVQ